MTRPMSCSTAGMMRATMTSTPCSSGAQCGVLRIVPAAGNCSCPAYIAFSLVSATADAASTAAAAQNAAAMDARNRAGLGNACLCVQPPVATCVASACTLSIQ